MDTEKLKTELLEIEAWAEGLRKKCRKTRMNLEGVSTPSAPPGNKEIVAAAVAKRNQRMQTRTKSSEI